MGTNYYLHQSPPCPTCGHQKEPLHIGKSSGGWCFSLHVDEDIGVSDLDDWRPLLYKPSSVIVDEYGKKITPDEMLSIITERSWPLERSWTPKMLQDNHAMPGPNGLVRSQLGRFCVKHGAGTWDCLKGEFS